MQKRGSITGGLILILVGAFFLILEFFPDLAVELDIARQWPLFIVGLGGLFLIAAIGTPGLAVSGSVVGGIGLLLYYQNTTGNWGSWAFAWTLIPGFVGVGMLLEGVLKGKFRHGIKEGGQLIITSLALFAIFGSFLSNWLNFGQVWPFLLILAGVWMLIKNVFRGRRPAGKSTKQF